MKHFGKLLNCAAVCLVVTSSARALGPSNTDKYVVPHTTSRAAKEIVSDIPPCLLDDPHYVTISIGRLKNGDFSAHIVSDVMSFHPTLMHWMSDVVISNKIPYQRYPEQAFYGDGHDHDEISEHAVGDAVAAAWDYIVSREHVDPKASEFRFKLWFSRNIGNSHHKLLPLPKGQTQVRVYADFPGRYVHTGLFAQVTVSGRDGHLTFSDYRRSYGENTGQ